MVGKQGFSTVGGCGKLPIQWNGIIILIKLPDNISTHFTVRVESMAWFPTVLQTDIGL